MRDVIIYCDGSGIAGGHPCGFAAILFCDGAEMEVVGSLDVGTNNVAEIMAAVIGLEALKKPSTVIVRSDSMYLVNAINLRWLNKWERNGWERLAPREEGEEHQWVPVPNAAYWQRLLRACAPHKAVFQHVKGHNGDPLNERCDRLAGQARKRHGVKPLPLAYNADGTRREVPQLTP